MNNLQSFTSSVQITFCNQILIKESQRNNQRNSNIGTSVGTLDTGTSPVPYIGQIAQPKNKQIF